MGRNDHFDTGIMETGRSAEDLYGAGDVDAMFHGSPVAPTPWPRAAMRKSVQTYDKSIVHNLLQTPVRGAQDLTDVDPRALKSTQPSVTRAGVQHYMTGEYERTGETYADKGNVGNQYPVVYGREGGDEILLSGHHRAAAALVQGRPLRARRVTGPWGGPR